MIDHGGRLDPADPKVLVVPLPKLAIGAFTVDWRSLSAADGHQASGFVSFGVGSVDPARVSFSLQGLAGDRSHDGGSALLEIQSRTIADLGFMLAFGLVIIALGVLAHAGLAAGWVVGAQVLGLAVAGVGALLLAFVAGSAPDVDPVGFLGATRPGRLLAPGSGSPARPWCGCSDAATTGRG